MSIILNDEQCLQWIKDPSITPYVQKSMYIQLKAQTHFIIEFIRSKF